jgi:hypothetical protein
MEKNKIQNLNLLALYLFSSLILAAGGLVYFAPDLLTLLSISPSYNLFRVNLGLIGIIIALTYNYTLIKYFNFLAGAIYVYQVVASMMHLFPEEHFKWSATDTIINTDIGLSFLFVSLLAITKK